MGGALSLGTRTVSREEGEEGEHTWLGAGKARSLVVCGLRNVRFGPG